VALQKRLKKDENNLDNAADVIHGNWTTGHSTLEIQDFPDFLCIRKCLPSVL